jgi:hypothetical protein
MLAAPQGYIQNFGLLATMADEVLGSIITRSVGKRNLPRPSEARLRKREAGQ